jgi:hypothetical protein
VAPTSKAAAEELDNLASMLVVDPAVGFKITLNFGGDSADPAPAAPVPARAPEAAVPVEVFGLSGRRAGGDARLAAILDELGGAATAGAGPAPAADPDDLLALMDGI